MHCVHFVGFRGAEYRGAVAVWGRPDFFHYTNDPRWPGDVAPGDTVVFADGCEARPTSYAFNDSECH